MVRAATSSAVDSGSISASGHTKDFKNGILSSLAWRSTQRGSEKHKPVAVSPESWPLAVAHTLESKKEVEIYKLISSIF